MVGAVVVLEWLCRYYRAARPVEVEWAPVQQSRAAEGG